MNGPLVKGLDQVWNEGLNCQLLVHAVWDELFPEYSFVPKRWRSSELFAAHTYLQEVKVLAEAKPGDLCFLGRDWWQPQPNRSNSDAQKLHLGVVVAQVEETWIVHASYARGKVVVEPLSEVQRQARYKHLFSLKRVIKANFRGFS